MKNNTPKLYFSVSSDAVDASIETKEFAVRRLVSELAIPLSLMLIHTGYKNLEINIVGRLESFSNFPT